MKTNSALRLTTLAAVPFRTFSTNVRPQGQTRHFLAALLFVLLTVSTAYPCSRVLWAPTDGLVFVGRTNDWTGKVDSKFRLFPRGIDRVGSRNVSVPFGLGDPEKPNISPTYFRTVMELSGGRYYFESTLAPNVVWIETSKLDFSKGLGEQELAVEDDILKLHGDVTSQFVKASPLVFGRHEP